MKRQGTLEKDNFQGKLFDFLYMEFEVPWRQSVGDLEWTVVYNYVEFRRDVSATEIKL